METENKTIDQKLTIVIDTQEKHSAYFQKINQRLDLAEKRLEENDECWIENDKRWIENDRRWIENDRRWDENDRRWDENEKAHDRLEKKIDILGLRFMDLEQSVKLLLSSNNDILSYIRDCQNLRQKVEQVDDHEIRIKTLEHTAKLN